MKFPGRKDLKKKMPSNKCATWLWINECYLIYLYHFSAAKLHFLIFKMFYYSWRTMKKLLKKKFGFPSFAPKWQYI